MVVIHVLMDILCTMVPVYNVLNLQVYMEPVHHVAQKHKVLNSVALIAQWWQIHLHSYILGDAWYHLVVLR